MTSRAPRSPGAPIHPLKVFRPLAAIVLITASRQGHCLRLIACFPGEGRTGCTLRSSSGPTSFVFNLVHLRAPLPPLPVFFCLFRSGLGVCEKPRCGSPEHTPSTVAFHLLPTISPRNLSVSHGILWGWRQLMALSSPLCVLRLC